ncbi:hypothetical protein GCK72_007214 [Caenorhabditis remanei]|uniref:PAZ domain-containing protein n=1 Tax=Caenorhabditis remanei TaxID=31234 RepID=A0A6A5HIH8_CAERE|nr:hypothetical protein GCK72_007214 [Caenorhabditis remanei]KAF1767255.1 hypothetical protein GCK72_007214 [Caenorhabditis remanei]
MMLETFHDSLTGSVPDGTPVVFVSHRKRQPILGRTVIENFPAMDARFWYRSCKRWLSVEEYVFVNYGYDLRYPKGYVCRLIPAEYEEADCEVKAENLFPLEVS